MNHLNTGDGFSGTDAYQTWDHVQCPVCHEIAIELYHTCFVSDTDVKPRVEIEKHISLKIRDNDKRNFFGWNPFERNEYENLRQVSERGEGGMEG
jgi:hypothetical protein